jgi:hypothetical protein
MRAFLVATLVLVTSVVTPVLSTPLGYAVVPLKLAIPTDLFVVFAALMWLHVIVTPHLWHAHFAMRLFSLCSLRFAMYFKITVALSSEERAEA